MATGERIKLARQALEMTPAQLAALIEVPEADLVAYENDKQEAEPEVLWNLAQEVGLELGFFLRTLPVTPVNFALTRADAPPWQETIIAQTRIWLENYLDIESFLPVEEIPLFVHPDPFPITITAPKEAAEAADALRDAWKLGPLPTPDLPDVLEVYGIKVGMIDGVDGFEAAAFWTADDLQLPFIVMNRTLPGSAQRFALAQELAYLMLTGATPQTAPHFAGSFLMPARALKTDLGEHRTKLDYYELALLKAKYGVSMRHLLVRSASLRIIPREVLDDWMNRFKAQGWDKQEPGDQPIGELPARVVQIIVRLRAEEEITDERAAELLGLDLDSWHELTAPEGAVAPVPA